MGWFSWIQQLFTADSSSHAALSQYLSMLAGHAVNASGYVYPRWNAGGFYNVRWGPLIDQQPHFILAIEAAAAVTGDLQWLASVEAALDKVSGYMLRRGLNSSRASTPNVIPGVPAPGVFTTVSSGLSDGGEHATNWYDIVLFGGADAYVAAYAVDAMRAMADVKSALGKNAEAAEYRRILQLAKAAYSAAFWSDEAGYFCDWVDITGRRRLYGYADVQHLAIVFGIANKTQAHLVLKMVDGRYAELVRAFGLRRDDLWATPSNFFPASYKDVVGGKSGPSSAAGPKYGDMPYYENGGSFFHSVGVCPACRAHVISLPMTPRYCCTTLILTADPTPSISAA